MAWGQDAIRFGNYGYGTSSQQHRARYYCPVLPTSHRFSHAAVPQEEIHGLFHVLARSIVSRFE